MWYIHRMNYLLFSHKNEWSTDMCDNTDEPWKHYTSERCQAQNGYKSHDSIYIKHAKEEIYRDRKQSPGFLGRARDGAGKRVGKEWRMESDSWKVQHYFLSCQKGCKIRLRWWLHNPLKILKTTELYIHFKWVNFMIHELKTEREKASSCT